MSAPSRTPSSASAARGRASGLAAAALLAALALGAVAPRPTAAADDAASPAAEREQSLNERRRAAIERGARWIATNQGPGGFFGAEKARVAFTALSTLALMAQGSGVDRGVHGRAIRRGVEFLVRLVEEPPQSAAELPRGYFHLPSDHDSRMHGQGYAILALASALSSADAELHRRIRLVLREAIRCAEDAQTGTGGWGYEPHGGVEHEGSVTVTVAQGLRAARDAGLHVSDAVVQAGLAYLRRSQKRPGPQDPDHGSFKYSLSHDRSTYALTAAAISSFFLFGEYGRDADARERIDDGIAYMKRQLRLNLSRSRWFYYGHFYAAWAAWQKDGDKPLPEAGMGWEDGDPDADLEASRQFWGPWHAKVYAQLLDMQDEQGFWRDDQDEFQYGELLPTAFAVLTLAIPDETLPVFQR